MNYDGNHQLLSKLMDSYKSAVADPRNELIHLYEITDAIKSNYGNKVKAMQQLKISELRWDRLHILSNNKPFKESRHRGRNAILQNASDEELDEAREIAREMIKAVASKR